MKRLENKVAIVTGCAGGLGPVVAMKLASEGAKVIATDINEEGLVASIAKVKTPEMQIETIKQDIASEEDWQKVMAFACERFGKVNVVVNNAAVRCEKNIENCEMAEWEKVMAINATGTFLGIKYGAKEMEKVGGGSIVNIDSIGGIVSGDADGADVAYSASKGAVRTMTKHAAINLCGKNIRCNSIHPGGIMTPMLKTVFDANPSLWEGVKSTCPLAPHINDPEDIANGVLFLASDESRTITGVELPIDCGYLAH